MHASLFSSGNKNSLLGGAGCRLSSEEKAFSQRQIVAVRLF